jgi:multidrug efflux pump subunit AcrA (membrane-fusion protein)
MAAEVMDFDEVSASPAYASLDELAEAGRLTQAQVQLFKSKFAKLHEVVLKTYENEKSLLKKAKQLNADLGNERTKLEEATKQAEVDSERVSQLRAEVGYSRTRTQSLAQPTQARLAGLPARAVGDVVRHGCDGAASPLAASTWVRGPQSCVVPG